MRMFVDRALSSQTRGTWFKFRISKSELKFPISMQGPQTRRTPSCVLVGGQSLPLSWPLKPEDLADSIRGASPTVSAPLPSDSL
ncbi:hypothetical protein CDAR_241361 [Caerostris darwini]|uniref:Uncharacterized protein n=1 Tax=Caerostris darwini TaxID=1538125 RepID=A0AAV4TJI1_9ARAC|nr:hypothetical protein CDAR_241361 [Caerostris darwini]